MKRSSEVISSEDEDDPTVGLGECSKQTSSKPTGNNENVGKAQSTPSPLAVAVPCILDGEFFEIISRDGDGNVRAKCKKCLHKIICGNISTTGNFRTHYKLKHKASLSSIDAKKTAAKTTSKHTPTRTSSHQRAPKETDFFGKRAKDKISQEEARNAISAFIVEEMLPLSTVEKPSFQNLCTELSRGTKEPLKFPSRRSFVEDLKQRKERMLYSIKSKLDESDYVCTTADLWTSNNKSYLGVTCHTIDKDTLDRESYVLAIRRILFRHTHDRIAESLYEIHEEFNITEKITKTVTDNASNFGKAFDVYGLLELEEDTPTPIQDIAGEDGDGEKEEEDDDFVPVPKSVDSILSVTEVGDESDRSQITLPKHMRCCVHTINLVITSDIAKIKDKTFNSKYKAAFGKMQAMWNLANKSTNAADTVEKNLGCKLPAPNKTRWFALLRAVKFALSKSVNKSKLDELFEELNLPKLTSAEYLFLVEYCNLTEHLANALDILQGEKACYYGLVVPSLLVLQRNLSASSFPNLIHCEPLRLCMLESISKRFEKFLGIVTEQDLRHSEWKDAFLATVAHPRFKLNGVPSDLRKACETLFLEQCEKTEATMKRRASETASAEAGPGPAMRETGNAKKDFFSALDPPPGTRTEVQNKQAKAEALMFLGTGTTDSLDCLHQYPVVKEVFVKFNTMLPSEAPVERLFSVGGQVRNPRRNRLSDSNFEMLVMLKANHY